MTSKLLLTTGEICDGLAGVIDGIKAVYLSACGLNDGDEARALRFVIDRVEEKASDVFALADDLHSLVREVEHAAGPAVDLSQVLEPDDGEHRPDVRRTLAALVSVSPDVLRLHADMLDEIARATPEDTLEADGILAASVAKELRMIADQAAAAGTGGPDNG